jgi:hypothetical protein
MFTLGNGMRLEDGKYGEHGIDKLWKLMGTWVGWLKNMYRMLRKWNIYLEKSKTKDIMQTRPGVIPGRGASKPSLILGSSPSPLRRSFRSAKNLRIKQSIPTASKILKNYHLVGGFNPLKNISQLGWLFPIYGKIKHVPSHQPETIFMNIWQRSKVN